MGNLSIVDANQSSQQPQIEQLPYLEDLACENEQDLFSLDSGKNRDLTPINPCANITDDK